MRRYAGMAIVVLIVAGAIAALAGGGGHDGSTSLERASTDTPQGADGSPSAAGGADTSMRERADADGGLRAQVDDAVAESNAAISAAPVPGMPSRVVKNATVEVQIRGGQLDARVRAARHAAEAAGGFVEQTEQSRGRASITLRVPAASYAAVLDRIEGLGRVRSRAERGEDVTAQFVDLEARLRNLRAQEAVLVDLMSDARSIPDTVTVQQQLAGVREQIEQLTAQQTLLDGQSSFATIAIGFQVRGVAPTPSDDSPSLADAWTDARDALVAVVGGMVVVLGAVLPFAVLALLGYVGWNVVRRRRPDLGGA